MWPADGINAEHNRWQTTAQRQNALLDSTKETKPYLVNAWGTYLVDLRGNNIVYLVDVQGSSIDYLMVQPSNSIAYLVDLQGNCIT